MTTDPMEMVADLRRKAARLNEAADIIEDEYGQKPAEQRANGKPPETPVPAQAAARGERLIQLIDFLKEHGPKRRQELIEATGIPTGTIAHLLRRDQFKQDAEGRWDIAPNEADG